MNNIPFSRVALRFTLRQPLYSHITLSAMSCVYHVLIKLFPYQRELERFSYGSFKPFLHSNNLFSHATFDVPNTRGDLSNMIFAISVGWIIFILLITKLLYSLCNFIYSVYLAAALGHSLDLRRYGPWAGKDETQ